MSAAGLVAVRHPLVAATGICYGGGTDVPIAGGLAPAAKQMFAAIDELGRSFDVVWTSLLSRCATVAHLIAERAHLELRADARLGEINFGRWEGRPWTQIETEDRAAFAAWTADWATIAPPGGESVPMFEARVRGWWAELGGSGSHILVAHAGVMRALRVITGTHPWPAAMAAPVPAFAPEPFGLPDAYAKS